MKEIELMDYEISKNPVIHEDEFAFAKGCFWGSLMGISMWMIIILLIKTIWMRMH